MSWKQAMEQCVLGLANYMIPIGDLADAATVEMHTEGAANEHELVYQVLDEYLFRFATELFAARSVTITQCDDAAATWTCSGETFVRGKHEQGTEVKAITMHNMRIYRQPDGSKTNIFVTLDI